MRLEGGQWFVEKDGLDDGADPPVIILAPKGLLSRKRYFSALQAFCGLEGRED